MKKLLCVLLLIATPCMAYDTSSVSFQEGKTHRWLQSDSSWKYYDDGVECTQAEYIVACADEDDKVKDLNNWRPEDKAMMKTMYYILSSLGYTETVAQFKQRIKDNFYRSM